MTPHLARLRQLHEAGRVGDQEWLDAWTEANARRTREHTAVRRAERAVSDAEQALVDQRTELNRLGAVRSAIKTNVLDESVR